jgi:hypothetical protein
VPGRAPFWATLRGRPGAAGRVYFADYARVPFREYEAERWAKARAAFEEGAAVAKAQGIGLALVYVPIKLRVYRNAIDVPAESLLRECRPWDELPRLFDELCAAVGTPCLDLTGPLARAAEAGAMPYARTDTHWDVEGHALAADEVARFLHDHGLLPSPAD